MEYCSSLQCKLDKPKLFCHNCSLRRQQVGPLDVSNLEEIPLDNGFIVKGDTSIFLGSMNDLLEDWKGQDMWTIATDLLIDLRNEL